MKRLKQCILLICLAALLLTACGKSGADKVETPAAMSMQRGRNYKEVVEDFEDKGFTNIRVEPIEDLRIGWVVKYEEVEEISVGGDTNYDAGVLVPADTEVVIRYHSYNTSLEEEAETAETAEVPAKTESPEKTSETKESAESKKPEAPADQDGSGEAEESSGKKKSEKPAENKDPEETADSASTEAAPAP